MDTQHYMEERLWEYIDGASGAEEKLFIEQLIATQTEWRTKYAELLEVHHLMQQHLELDEPSMRFTQNVMEEIGKYKITPAAQSYINKRVIYGIAAFFILTIVGFLIYGLSQVQWTSGGGSNGLYSVNVNLDKIDYSKIFNNRYTNIFLMVTIVLGLMFLDMYLGRKKKDIQQKTL